MKSLNRTLSLVLVLCMVLGLFGIASAAYTDTTSIKNTTAVETLSALNIISGRTNGSFDPTGIVTRAEMCKMICVALNGGSAPVLGTNPTPSYKDIKGHWAEAYIESCSKLGIVAGMGDGTFAPDATVTGSQAAKMILVALGYDSKTEGFTGSSWEIAVGVRASSKGLYSGLSLNPSAGLTRDNAAGLIYNGLNAVLVSYEYKLVTGSNGQLTTVSVAKDDAGKATIASSKFGLVAKYGTITKVTYNPTTTKYTYTVVAAASSGYTLGNFSSTTDYSSMFEQSVRILYMLDNNSSPVVYGVYPSGTTAVFKGIFAQMSNATWAADTRSFAYDGVTYKLNNTAASIDVFEFNNNIAAGNLSTYGTAAKAAYSFVMLDVDADNVIDRVVAYPFTVAQVTYVGSTTATIGNTSVTLANVTAYTGMAKGDYVKVTAAANSATGKDTYEKITTFTGTVTEKTSTKVKIGDTWYLNTVANLNLGGSYKDIAQVNGVIFAGTVTSSVTSATQYAVLIGSAAASGLNGDQAKLMFSDGTIKTVDTTANYSGVINNDTLVTFAVNTAGKYTLTASTTKGSYDTDLSGSAYAYVPAASAGYIGGAAIDDSAVMFVKVTGVGYKVLTGAQFKTLATASVTGTVTKAYATLNGSTGFNTVKLAFATISSTASGLQPYGYVTKVTSVLGDGATIINNVSFWNGTEVKTLKTTSDLSATIKAGMIITYTTNADGSFNPSVPANLKLSAVTGYDGTNITFEDAAASTSISSTKTTVLYIDSADGSGLAGGSISLAGKDASNKYIDNAYYIDGGASVPFALIVYDVKNAIADTSVTVASAAADTAAELAALFDSYNTVTISDTYVPAAAIAVPASKTLVATTATLANAVTGAGTLSVGTFTNGATSAAFAQTSIVKLTAQSAGTVYEAIPGAASKTLILSVASTGDAVGVTATATTPAKFYKAPGTLSATVGVAATPAVSGVTTAGVIEAGTYTWNTTTINSGSATAASNTTAYAAWLK